MRQLVFLLSLVLLGVVGCSSPRHLSGTEFEREYNTSKMQSLDFDESVGVTNGVMYLLRVRTPVFGSTPNVQVFFTETNGLSPGFREQVHTDFRYGFPWDTPPPPVAPRSVLAGGKDRKQSRMGAPEGSSSFSRYNDTSELDRCISLIESNQIRRGMTTGELKELFPAPDALFFRREEEATALLSRPRHVSARIFQWSPQWQIIFSFKDGHLSDYRIAIWEGK